MSALVGISVILTQGKVASPGKDGPVRKVVAALPARSAKAAGPIFVLKDPRREKKSERKSETSCFAEPIERRGNFVAETGVFLSRQGKLVVGGSWFVWQIAGGVGD